jgi:O-antigen/teichoic acid export membrane protein
MNDYKLFTQQIGLIGITNLIISLRGIILLPILTKTLGAYDYGVLAQIMVTISLCTPLVTIGLLSGITRFLAAETDKKEIQEGFFSSLIVIFFSGIVLSSLLFLSSNFLAQMIFHTKEAIPLIKISAFIILIWALDRASLQFFRTRRQMTKYSGFLLLENFGELGLITYLVLNGFGLFGVVISLLIVKAISFGIMLFVIISQIGIKLPHFTKIRPYLVFGLPMLPSYIFVWIINSSDLYVIGYFMDSASVGVYSAAYGIGVLISMFIGPISIVLYPAILKLWKEDKIEEIKIHLEYSMKYFLMLAIPSTFGLSVLAEQLLIVFTTSQFVYGSVLIPIIAVSSIFSSFYSINMYILAMVKKTKIIGALLMIAAIVNIILNLIFVPLIGILGAAISTLVSFLILSLLMYYLAVSNIKFELGFRFILKSLFASFVMSFLIFGYNPTGITNVLISIGFATGIYFGLLLLLKGFSKDELKFLKSLFKIS